MADFFDKIIKGANKAADKISEGVDTVAEKGDTLIKISRIKSERVKLEETRKERVLKLGEDFYEMLKSDDLQISDLRSICDEIQELEAQIQEKLDEEEALREKK